ncbi:fructosamine kinase family protein [Actinomyces sp. W5033]|uniref:fructosamine kinase family protein n=1 Tax=Actinomyces sp. W5033 TaxID=3446479 RepID=UPI003EE31284
MSSRPKPTIRKTDDFPGATRLEAQGLEWLAEAMPAGGAHVVPVTIGDGWIEEPHLSAGRVTPEAARAFGRALAVTHAAGAPAFGAAPPGWDGRTRMGRSDIRLRPHAPETPGDEPRPWGRFYSEDRILPYIGPGRDAGSLSRGEAGLIERVCARLADGNFDTPQPELTRRRAQERGERVAVARSHGDLWTGNVLWVPTAETASWAPEGAGCGPGGTDRGGRGGGPGSARSAPGVEVVGVLIDPMAHGAHAETDLAALGVFGQRFLGEVYAGYDEVSALADGWQERVGLHQLHMLMIHVFLFGGGYGAQAAALARRYV